MTDIPIIFSGPMVRALLEGRKTMTRRLAHRWNKDNTIRLASVWQAVKPGDRLWVRENVIIDAHEEEQCRGNREYSGTYAAGGAELPEDWRGWAPEPRRWNCYDVDVGREPKAWGIRKKWTVPSIHMPRWASRLTLEVTATKVERLQAITYRDAVDEGVSFIPGSECPQECFRHLWEGLHGTGTWASNPEVVAITFKVHQRNIDVLKEAA